MAEAEGSRQRRLHSFGPNMAILTNFPHKYMAYLLLALFKVEAAGSRRRNKYQEIDKIVRFEVDMALVVSASGFAWSRALKQMLERGMNAKQPSRSPAQQLVAANFSFTCKKRNGFDMVEMFDRLWTVPLISRPLAPASSKTKVMPKIGMHKTTKPKRVGRTLSTRRKLARGDGELQYCLGTLRKTLPGGNEMDVSELLSEVQSYVICLQMQVSTLRSILAAQQQLF